MLDWNFEGGLVKGPFIKLWAAVPRRDVEAPMAQQQWEAVSRHLKGEEKEQYISGVHWILQPNTSATDVFSSKGAITLLFQTLKYILIIH